MVPFGRSERPRDEVDDGRARLNELVFDLTDTEVGQLRRVVIPDQNVRRFHIPVHHVVLVRKCKARQQRESDLLHEIVRS